MSPKVGFVFWSSGAYPVAMDEPDYPKTPIARRFRGFLPVVVDVETAGFDPQRHALLEIAAVPIRMADDGRLEPGATIACHVLPFLGSEVDPRALAFNKIDPDHPFRDAIPEQEAAGRILTPIRRAVKSTGCTRAVMVAHNAAFDLGFIRALVDRTGYKHNPFHSFSVFDTVTLAGLVYGQTVLAKAAQMAGLGWNNREAHSAIYDVEQTARLFCAIVNRWGELDPIRPWEARADEDQRD